MATTSQGTLSTPIITSDSPATTQRRMIPLKFVFPDSAIISAPMEESIEVSIESVDTKSYTVGSTTIPDYIVTLKINQVLSYCAGTLLGARNRTRNKVYYDTFVFPGDSSTTVPTFTAQLDYTVFNNFCDCIAPNIAKIYNHVIAVTVTSTTPPAP